MWRFIHRLFFVFIIHQPFRLHHPSAFPVAVVVVPLLVPLVEVPVAVLLLVAFLMLLPLGAIGTKTGGCCCSEGVSWTHDTKQISSGYRHFTVNYSAGEVATEEKQGTKSVEGLFWSRRTHAGQQRETMVSFWLNSCGVQQFWETTPFRHGHGNKWHFGHLCLLEGSGALEKRGHIRGGLVELKCGFWFRTIHSKTMRQSRFERPFPRPWQPQNSRQHKGEPVRRPRSTFWFGPKAPEASWAKAWQRSRARWLRGGRRMRKALQWSNLEPSELSYALIWKAKMQTTNGSASVKGDNCLIDTFRQLLGDIPQGSGDLYNLHFISPISWKWGRIWPWGPHAVHSIMAMLISNRCGGKNHDF